MAAADPPPVTTTAGYLLYKAGVFGQRMFDDALGEVGLSAREFLALSFVSGDSLSQQDLARRMGLDPTIIVGLLDDLEGRGFVTRDRDPSDRRRNALVVTNKGRHVLRKAGTAAAISERDFLAPLDRREREQLAELLRRLMAPKLPWLTSAAEGASGRAGIVRDDAVDLKVGQRRDP